MKRSLTEIVKQNKKYYTFVETGCSAHGTKSTLLWDKFVNIFDIFGTIARLDTKCRYSVLTRCLFIALKV